MVAATELEIKIEYEPDAETGELKKKVTRTEREIEHTNVPYEAPVFIDPVKVNAAIAYMELQGWI